MIKTLMPFNLQFFSEDDSKDDENGQTSTNDSSNEKDNEENKNEKIIKLTQEEFDKAIQKRLDRDRQKQEEERRREKMSAQEKYDDLKRQMDERDALERTRTALHDKGLSSVFAPFLSSVDEEKATENINSFSEAFNSAVEARVEELMKDKTPPKPTTDDKAKKGDDFLGGLNKYF